MSQFIVALLIGTVQGFLMGCLYAGWKHYKFLVKLSIARSQEPHTPLDRLYYRSRN